MSPPCVVRTGGPKQLVSHRTLCGHAIPPSTRWPVRPERMNGWTEGGGSDHLLLARYASSPRHSSVEIVLATTSIASSNSTSVSPARVCGDCFGYGTSRFIKHTSLSSASTYNTDDKNLQSLPDVKLHVYSLSRISSNVTVRLHLLCRLYREV